jgi:shikimate dehydrogenase
MNPTADATLCISVSARPSRFGITVHNAGYRALGLDFQYKAFGTDDIAGAIAGVRALGIRGCSVSMPFKQSVISHLDRLDPRAETVGAVNTVVNDDGVLTGYNTDIIGAFEALKFCAPSNKDRALVMGAGGVARAVIQALREHGVPHVTVCARNPEQAAALAGRFEIDTTDWDDRETIPADICVNATSIGMKPDIDSSPLHANSLTRFRAVMDVVASPPDTQLIADARRANVNTVDGMTMTLHQACAQFTLYTGHEAPYQVMRDAALSLQ